MSETDDAADPDAVGDDDFFWDDSPDASSDNHTATYESRRLGIRAQGRASTKRRAKLLAGTSLLGGVLGIIAVSLVAGALIAVVVAGVVAAGRRYILPRLRGAASEAVPIEVEDVDTPSIDPTKIDDETLLAAYRDRFADLSERVDDEAGPNADSDA